MTIANPALERSPLPRLNITGPVLLGVAVFAAFLAAGLALAVLVSVDRGAAFAGRVVVEPKVTIVSPAKGGVAARVHVSDGATVGAGDLLVSLDASALDELIRSLTAQADAAARQLAELRQAAASAAKVDPGTSGERPHMPELGRSAAALEKQAADLLARIAVAEQTLAQSAIRAPAAGRVRLLSTLGPNSVIAPGAPLIEIESAGNCLVLDGFLPARDIAAVKPGMHVKVWLAGSLQALAARLAWVSTELIEDPRGAAAYLVRVEFDGTAAEALLRAAHQAGGSAQVMVVTGQRTLLAGLLDPIRRNVRLFRI